LDVPMIYSGNPMLAEPGIGAVSVRDPRGRTAQPRDVAGSGSETLSRLAPE